MALLRRYLIAGLLVWIPVGLTVFIIKLIVDLMDRLWLLLPESYRPINFIGTHIPGLGVILAIIVLLLTGVVVANLIGRRLMRIGEWLVARIPFVRTIYYNIKQVTETIFAKTGQSFRKVVLIEYPRKGVWTVAFVSGDSPAGFEQKLGQACVNVFVPTTPNPTSGFFLIVPQSDVVDVGLSLDDGIKMIISAGVVAPQSNK